MPAVPKSMMLLILSPLRALPKQCNYPSGHKPQCPDQLRHQLPVLRFSPQRYRGLCGYLSFNFLVVLSVTLGGGIISAVLMRVSLTGVANRLGGFK